MIPITNAKVETLDPTWTRFLGYSLLFDNPGRSLVSYRNSQLNSCNVDSSPELTLYKELSQAVKEIDTQAAKEFGICLLPSSSYHVTFFDCGNQANAADAHAAAQPSLGHLLEGLPHSWTEDHALVRPAAEKAASLSADLPISFRFSRLKNWSNVVLVAVLEPTEDSSDRFQRIVEERALLSSDYLSSYGFGAGAKFTPHVSLAYFANPSGAENSMELCQELEGVLRRRTDGLEICFNSISAYAFTDMATFFRHT